jgi:hypothetical protein
VDAGFSAKGRCDKANHRAEKWMPVFGKGDATKQTIAPQKWAAVLGKGRYEMKNPAANGKEKPFKVSLERLVEPPLTPTLLLTEGRPGPPAGTPREK